MEITKSTKKEKILSIGHHCKKCGNCCSLGAGFAQKDELQKIAKHLKISVDKLKDEYFDETSVFNKIVYRPKLIKKSGMPYGPCVFLKNNECSIHNVKPLHCRVGNCNAYGEKISEWYTVNYLVDKKNAESIREWATRVSLKPTVKGGTPIDLVKNKNTLKQMLEYKIR